MNKECISEIKGYIIVNKTRYKRKRKVSRVRSTESQLPNPEDVPQEIACVTPQTQHLVAAVGCQGDPPSSRKIRRPVNKTKVLKNGHASTADGQGQRTARESKAVRESRPRELTPE